MTKKEYMLKVLDLIKDIFPPAKDFQILVEGDNLGEEVETALLAMLQEVSTSLADQEDKAKLDKSIEFLNGIKAQEQVDQTKDDQKLKELETIFNQI